MIVRQLKNAPLLCLTLLTLARSSANATNPDLARRARNCDKFENATISAEEDNCASLLNATRQSPNYPLETHSVTTEDGYVLSLHRIAGPAAAPVPVYLQHGLLESSADWILAGRGRSLAYILRDHGYDVWLGNARGNTYSKKHTTLSASDPKFWNFSWHELGVYDLPAVITYITNLTNNSLFFIGHSMAATTFSVMAIERPEVAQRVKAMIALAPATYVHNMRAPVRLLSYFWRRVQDTLYRLGIYEIFPRGPLFNTFAERVCTTNLLRNIFCSNPLFFMAGFSPEQLDYSLLPAIWKKFPAGTSTKLFIHWLQQIAVNKFRQFDYGPSENVQMYNSYQPPAYDLSKVQVPIAVFWSANDWLVGGKDVKYFYNQLVFKLGSYKVNNDKFNHFDFLWALDAPMLVYCKVLSIMNEFDNNIDR